MAHVRMSKDEIDRINRAAQKMMPQAKITLSLAIRALVALGCSVVEAEPTK